jgi:hypothetical protein
MRVTNNIHIGFSLPFTVTVTTVNYAATLKVAKSASEASRTNHLHEWGVSSAPSLARTPASTLVPTTTPSTIIDGIPVPRYSDDNSNLNVNPNLNLNRSIELHGIPPPQSNIAAPVLALEELAAAMMEMMEEDGEDEEVGEGGEGGEGSALPLHPVAINTPTTCNARADFASNTSTAPAPEPLTVDTALFDGEDLDGIDLDGL